MKFGNDFQLSILRQSPDSLANRGVRVGLFRHAADAVIKGASDQLARFLGFSAKLAVFDVNAWGNGLRAPYFVIAPSIAKETLMFSLIRLVCKPDLLTFVGREALIGDD